MKICLITDEISADPATAIELGLEWGVRDFELRGFFSNRVPELSDFQKKKIHDILSLFQARIIVISPGLFKIPFSINPFQSLPLTWIESAQFVKRNEVQRQVQYHLNELLPASLDYASEIGAGFISVFSFHRGEYPASEPPDEILKYFQLAAEKASSHKIKLVMENEDGFWADTGCHTAKIIKNINHPALKVNWDPANAFVSGEVPFPDGYSHVKGLIEHIHFKDVIRDKQGNIHYVSKGVIDWDGQIQSLIHDKYDNHISIETHMEPKILSARTELTRLRDLIIQNEV